MNVRFEIVKVRSRSSDSANAIQLSEIKLYDKDKNEIPIISVNASLTPTSTSENASKLIDNDTSTKYCSTAWGGSVDGKCVIDFVIEKEIYSYKYCTANDSVSRDPVSWNLYVDGELIDIVSNANITTSRNTYTDEFSIRWLMGFNSPYNRFAPDILEYTMNPPYPKALWRIEQGENNGLPFHELLPYVPPLGAGCHALNLRSIIIPNTTNSIGKNSFTFSRIRSVKLPTNCTYYSTSFPENCNVTGGIRLD